MEQRYPAAIETYDGRRMWRCPSCRRTLGELAGGRLIVKLHGRTLTFPVVVDMDQTCPKCGAVSVV